MKKTRRIRCPRCNDLVQHLRGIVQRHGGHDPAGYSFDCEGVGKKIKSRA